LRRVFLLGTERSGSTWVTNIFDAHPGVEVLMEPFADYAGLFPGFPGRNVCVPGPDATLSRILREGYARLPSCKYPLLYRPGRPAALMAIDQAAAFMTARLAARTRRSRPAWIVRHELLNLHQSAVGVAHRPRKESKPRVQVTKELRLNLKAPLLEYAFPGSAFVVTLRHPGAQIASVRRLMQTGRLAELRRSLDGFVDAVLTQERLRPYRSLVNRARGMDENLAAWWVIHNDVLLSDLDALGARVMLVEHARLAQEPVAVTAEMLAHAGLTMTPEVEAYLRHSTTGHGSSSPLDTQRHSAEHARRTVADVSPEIRGALERVAQWAVAIELSSPVQSLLHAAAEREPVTPS
jgi:hypothetical protein